MEENNFFTVHQYGFRKERSCVTQLIEVVEKWSEELDNHNSIDAIYLDFQKAFDTVPHKRLIHKLKGYGISGNLLHWIEDFLHDRKQSLTEWCTFRLIHCYRWNTSRQCLGPNFVHNIHK